MTCENQIVSGRLTPTVNHLLLPVGETTLLSAVNINCAQGNGDIVIPLRPHEGSLTLLDDGKGIDFLADDGMYSQTWLAQTPGRYQFIFPENDVVTITVYDPMALQGYVYEAEPTFQYRQITGTSLDANDDGHINLDVPFSIKFGGSSQGFNVITVGSNGAVSITDSDTISLVNTSLPTDTHVSLIAPFGTIWILQPMMVTFIMTP